MYLEASGVAPTVAGGMAVFQDGRCFNDGSICTGSVRSNLARRMHCGRH